MRRVSYGRVYTEPSIFGECLRAGFWFVLLALAIILGVEFL